MNLPTLIISAIVLVIFGIIVIKKFISHKNGKTSCSCGCGGCAIAEMCHKK